MNSLPSGRPWRYDVALSFAGGDRNYVENVARALKSQGISCFYDADEEVALWGQHLAEVLPDIYMRQAAVVIVFVSASYARSDWTRLERRAALAEAVRQKREYVLPVRFDDTPLPGLISDLVSVRASGRSPEQLASLILAKLQGLDLLGRSHAGRDEAAGQPSSQSPVATAPNQLPRNPDKFTGRAAEMSELDQIAAEAADQKQPGVCLLSGMPSVGKTSLAVHWSCGRTTLFPDGQLYINLNGFGSGRPSGPSRVLHDFLTALGVAPAGIPQNLHARAALYRSIVSDSRMLVVLDNSASYAQIEHLLPASRQSFTVVTSRLHLSALVVNENAVRVNIEPFDLSAAMTFLEKIVGHDRVIVETEAASELARRAHGLPLALRTYGTLLASNPTMTFRSINDELSDTPTLDSLDQDGNSPEGARQSLNWSYGKLSVHAAAMLRAIGLHPGPEISSSAAAAAAGVKVANARRSLRQLSSASLLSEVADGRYRLHDLISNFADEKARIDMDLSDRSSTEDRIAMWYLHSANAADVLIAPQRRRISLDHIERPDGTLAFSTRAEAIEWCDGELSNIGDVAARIAARQRHEMTWRFGVVLWNYFYLRKSFEEWVHLSQLGVLAGQKLGDPEALFQSLNGLASAHRHQHRLAEAVTYFREALSLRDQIDDWSISWLVNNLAETVRGLGDHEEALDLYREAIRIADDGGDTWSKGCFLTNIGEAYAQLGDYDAAISSYQAALPLRRIHDHRYGEGWTYNDLGEAFQAQGRHRDALAAYETSLSLRRQVNDRYGEAWTLHNIATVKREQGRMQEARSLFEQALERRRLIGDRWGVARTADQLANLERSSENAAAAREFWREALGIYSEVDLERARIVNGLLNELEP
ncbi:tetratricopeptide repeat protein [Actinoplanes sp. NPDC051343]|uniref:tetratricopeptide repeat protein n=1 Tax=Actinoplanes sp. NPDC051343 TaxID=3363906 RepID=UPI00378A7AC9